MTVNKVRGDYEQLSQIAQGFSQQTESIRELVQTIQTAKTALENGDWVGKGADKFYREMNVSVMPAFERLVNALDTASRTTGQISRIIQQAEHDAAAVLRGDGGGAVLSAASASGSLFTSAAGSGASPAGGPAIVAPGPIDSVSQDPFALPSLQDRIWDMLGNQSPADPTPLLWAIQRAFPQERRAVLSDPQLMDLIRLTLGSGHGLAYVTAMFEGQLKWSGPSGADPANGYRIRPSSDFANWILGKNEHLKQPSIATGTMNCWEMIMFAAYKMGQVSYQQLVQLHERAAAMGQFASVHGEAMGRHMYKYAIAEAMGASNATPWFPGRLPPAGSVVFFDYDGKGPLSHVAISLGTRNADGKVEVMSLWGGAVKRTTLETLASHISTDLEKEDLKITFGTPTFR